METVRSAGSAVHGFYRSVVEWRSPATAPYLMLINSAFWATVFYCDAGVQLKMLISLAAGVFGWDVLLTPSHDRSIAIHLVMWPVQSLWRTLSVGCCLYSSHMLRKEELEVACWTAYSTVACLLINPVWVHYDVNSKLVDGASYCGSAMNSAAQIVIVSPSRKAFNAVKYVVLLQFVPPLWAYIKGAASRLGAAISSVFRSIWESIKNMGSTIANAWRSYVVEPTMTRVYAVGRWLRYWFCAYWWPDLKLWLQIQVVARAKRLFNYICFGLVYVFCGHWLPPLGRFIGRQLKALGGIINQHILQPSKRWMLARFEEFRIWLRAQLHRLAVAIRDSVIWPICVLVVDIGKEVSLLLYRTLLKPVLDYFYQRYKIVETAALVYLIGPVCKTIVENIPEKSPFCDDSDVELEGMLPSDMSEAEIGDPDEERPDSAAEFLPDTPLDDTNSVLEEEHDFVRGLAFPAINASESSDEEFDLRQKTKVVRRKRREKTPPPGGPEHEAGRRRRIADDEFELLQ